MFDTATINEAQAIQPGDEAAFKRLMARVFSGETEGRCESILAAMKAGVEAARKITH